jgi:archaellum component FlaF (FlaF/FlaG flagellin family)
MGLSVSVATAIIAVSVLIVVEISFGNLLPILTKINDSYDSFNNRALEKIQSDLNIDNVSTIINGSGYDLNITVENTGSIVIDTSHCNVLVNGSIHYFISSKSYIYPEKTASLSVYNLSGNGQFRLKFVSDLGISDYETFLVT